MTVTCLAFASLMLAPSRTLPRAQELALDGPLPPWAEVNAPYTAFGDLSYLLFFPVTGGSLTIATDAKGPGLGVFLNKVGRNLYFVSKWDVADVATSHVPLSFARSYRSELAIQGLSSPGLSAGWTDNYDITIDPAKDKDKWGDLYIRYPNGAKEKLPPILDDKGKPSGQFWHRDGTSYQTTGEPGDKTNTWNTLTLTWTKSRTTWVFTPHASGKLVLRYISKLDAPEKAVRLSYDPNRRLVHITDAGGQTSLLDFDYDAGGLISNIRAASGGFAHYRFATTDDSKGAPIVLWTVAVGTPTEELHETGRYSYINTNGKGLLGQISLFNQYGIDGWSASLISYDGAKVSTITNADGEKIE